MEDRKIHFSLFDKKDVKKDMFFIFFTFFHSIIVQNVGIMCNWLDFQVGYIGLLKRMKKRKNQ